jgi:hypothetical protein
MNAISKAGLTSSDKTEKIYGHGRSTLVMSHSHGFTVGCDEVVTDGAISHIFWRNWRLILYGKLYLYL